jgi:glycosyltransferase involved in cell wall biosynthesis
MYSLIVPVFRNAGALPALVEVLSDLPARLGAPFEVVFVIDGSPDDSLAVLKQSLPGASFPATILVLSRNFGSFAAIRAGLKAARGSYFAVMAADLQEPPELALEMFRKLRTEPVDIVVGVRETRADPISTRVFARIFWAAYRLLVQREMPRGGIDIFGCNEAARRALLEIQERNTSLIGLLIWIGFRRAEIKYRRRPRQGGGKSGWSFARKLRYMEDSIFAFSDLPIRLLVWIGGGGMALAACGGAAIFTARLLRWIEVPGYTATALLILFFGALNLASMGIVGSYVWRAFENTKGRPDSIILFRERIEQGAASEKNFSPSLTLS